MNYNLEMVYLMAKVYSVIIIDVFLKMVTVLEKIFNKISIFSNLLNIHISIVIIKHLYQLKLLVILQTNLSVKVLLFLEHQKCEKHQVMKNHFLKIIFALVFKVIINLKKILISNQQVLANEQWML